MTYPDPNSESARLFERASRVLPDGGSRSTIRMSPYSIFLKSARGKHIVDVDGVIRIDFSNNYTSLIHGHSHPAICRAVSEQLANGTAYSFGSEAEIKLAELLCERVPYFEKVRFMNSGTEAVMNAIKAARAYTGKAKIAKCENAYHGSYDYAEVSLGVAATDPGRGDPPSTAYSKGTPQGALEDVVVIPFNDVDNARRILEANVANLAGILFDPFGSGLGRIPPEPEFIQMLADFRQQHGVLLLADEVVAFRAGYSGCLSLYGVSADITALGKIIGGGFPVGAIAGSNEIMSVFETGEGKARLPHGGTFNANPITMAAGHAAMEMMDHAAFDRINALGARFREEIRNVLDEVNVQAQVFGQHSIFSIAVATPESGAPAAPRGHAQRVRGIALHLLNNGYFLSSGLLGCISTAMSDEDIDPFCQTLMEGLRGL